MQTTNPPPANLTSIFSPPWLGRTDLQTHAITLAPSPYLLLPLLPPSHPFWRFGGDFPRFPEITAGFAEGIPGNSAVATGGNSGGLWGRVGGGADGFQVVLRGKKYYSILYLSLIHISEPTRPI
eukprot:1119625-Amorphochlora_amoeboformis.AAC.1